MGTVSSLEGTLAIRLGNSVLVDRLLPASPWSDRLRVTPCEDVPVGPFCFGRGRPRDDEMTEA